MDLSGGAVGLSDHWLELAVELKLDMVLSQALTDPSIDHIQPAFFVHCLVLIVSTILQWVGQN